MKKKLLIIIVFSFIILLFFTACSQGFLEPNLKPVDYRVFFQKEYQLTKYEPEKGVYACSYVLQDVHIDCSMEKFNHLTGKQHASFFRYVGYGRPFPKVWVEKVKAAGAVPHIAFEPNQGLDAVKDDEYLRGFAKAARKVQVPIFLRYASEMNGAWPAYTGDPEKYIEKWQLVHNVMAEEAPNVIMVWSVFTFPQRTIPIYYPGDKYVDWVGVNIYNVVYHNNDLKQNAEHEDPLELLDFVYDMFGDRKPIQISEYGVTHYTVTDNKEHIEFAKSKIKRMYDSLPKWYPRVKAIFYFDVNNLINAPEGRKINNYSITDNKIILDTYKKLINQPHYLSEVKKNRESVKVYQSFNAKEEVYKDEQGMLYLSIHDLKKYMGLNLIKESNTYYIKTKDQKLPSENLKMITKADKIYIMIDPLLSKIDYKKKIDEKEKIITFSRQKSSS